MKIIVTFDVPEHLIQKSMARHRASRKRFKLGLFKGFHRKHLEEGLCSRSKMTIKFIEQ